MNSNMPNFGDPKSSAVIPSERHWLYERNRVPAATAA